MVDGKPLLATGLAKDLEEMIEKAGLKGEVVKAKPHGFEKIADWILKISPLLLLLGMAGAYMEVKMPGFGVPGFVSLISFGLFFFGHYAADLAGFEMIAVFVLGIILVVVEVWILPGLVIPGVIGGLMVVGSLFYTMIDYVGVKGISFSDGEFPSIDTILQASASPALFMGSAMLGSILIAVLAARYLPETKVASRLILQTSLSGGAVLEAPASKSPTGESSLVGQEGIAETDLRPSGKALIGNRLVDVVADASFLEKGTKVRITDREGSRIVVEPIG